MKSTKTFNNISDKLKAEIPKLKHGEKAIFQMLNGVNNPEPDEKERAKSPVLYGKMQLQTSFRIYDQYQKDSEGNEVGGYVDIGCVDSWVSGNPDKFRFFVPGSGEFAQFQGKFELTGGNIRDEELYEVLWLSNQREGNPHKDPSVEPLFKMIDLKSETKKLVTRYDTLRKALDLVNDMKDNEEKARKIMAALNQPSYQDKEVLMAKVGELASSNPELFIKVYGDPSIDVKYRIKEAFDRGVLTFDFPTGEVRNGGVLITKLNIGKEDSQVDSFHYFVTTSENGKGVLDNIESQLGGNKKEKKVKEVKAVIEE